MRTRCNMYRVFGGGALTFMRIRAGRHLDRPNGWKQRRGWGTLTNVQYTFRHSLSQPSCIRTRRTMERTRNRVVIWFISLETERKRSDAPFDKRRRQQRRKENNGDRKLAARRFGAGAVDASASAVESVSTGLKSLYSVAYSAKVDATSTTAGAADSINTVCGAEFTWSWSQRNRTQLRQMDQLNQTKSKPKPNPTNWKPNQNFKPKPTKPWPIKRKVNQNQPKKNENEPN